MARMKFVPAGTPATRAQRLYEVQKEIERLSAKLKPLLAEEEHLKNYLIRYSHGKSFIFNGDRYLMQAKITAHSRMILDQEKVKRILKTKTPYCESQWSSIKIDYVYQEE